MYVTRPLSQYRSNPESLSLPPEGPNSGYLVIQDEESEIYSCFGLCRDPNLYLDNLPFPQNMNLTTRSVKVFIDVKYFPVLNQPLSSNRYYLIEPHGRHKGKAYACSKKEDMITCCFCSQVHDVKPRPLDPSDTHQQFQIANYKARGSFYAKPVAQDAFSPYFLRIKGWHIRTETPRNYKLCEALGVNSDLRAQLPDLTIPVIPKSSKSVVVGKWYCPFMFIKDGILTLRGQMEKSMFYEMSLEQRWELIFECDNTEHTNVVIVDAVVQIEVVLVGGSEAVRDKRNADDKTIWFKRFGRKGGEVSVGLSAEIVERMKWEEERVGWVGGDETEVRVNREEEFGGGAEKWKKFRCYVLVERFILKRMYGGLVMSYDFKHTHQLKCIWE